MKAVGGWEPAQGLDIEKTPRRVARMLQDELLAGWAPGAEAELRRRFTTFPAGASTEMVAQGPIPFVSLCAHHLLPFVGEVWIGYIPTTKLAGLSKFTRVVRHFSRRLQMQELLTTQVADLLMEWLSASAVLVFCEARHYCMEARGVEAAGVVTKTSAIRGLAKTDPAVLAEFYRLIGR